jgi:hypothetical protein
MYRMLQLYWKTFTSCFFKYFICAWPPLWSTSQSSWLLNGDVLCFLWGTNCIYICYVEESRPPFWSSGQSSWLLNGDVLWFLWGTNRIYICYVEESRPPLWSSGQSSWLLNGDVFPVRSELNLYVMQKKIDRFCGLVVRVPGYRSRGPCSIPGATRFSEK